MTLFILFAWLIFTRAGFTAEVWPGGGAETARAGDHAPLDRVSVSLEAGMAAIALVIMPWAGFSRFFAPWEAIGLWLLWPFIVRYALDRIQKLRAGYLVAVADDGLVVPGLPARRLSWGDLRSVGRRYVRFGPDDVVFRADRGFPLVVDTQFCEWSEDELTAWAAAAAARHTGR